MRLRFLIAAVLGAVLAGAWAGPALAHECFNASRPAKGNEGANHAPVWETIFVSDFFGDPELGLTEEQIEDALDMWDALGNPDQFTIYVGNHTIMEGTAAAEQGLAANGKGIDHLEDAYFADFASIVCTVDPTNPLCAGGD